MNKTPPKYAVITYEKLQWSTYIVEFTKGNVVTQCYALDGGINRDNPFLTTICSRPISFYHARFTGKITSDRAFNGIYISKKEFARIYRMVELYPFIVEFNKLKPICKMKTEEKAPFWCVRFETLDDKSHPVWFGSEDGPDWDKSVIKKAAEDYLLENNHWLKKMDNIRVFKK